MMRRSELLSSSAINKAIGFWMDNSGIGQNNLYGLGQNTLEMNFLLLKT
ncbi:putative transposase [Arthrospira platensis NIES-39]|nr:putative transposase [Arthrospira platensis NIES-39]